MTSGKPKNGSRGPTPRATKGRVAKQGVTIKLDDAEAKQLVAEDKAIGVLKMQLANARLQRDQAEKRERNLCKQIVARSDAFKETANEMAEAHDIDLAAGAWTLQIVEGRFVQRAAN